MVCSNESTGAEPVVRTRSDIWINAADAVGDETAM